MSPRITRRSLLRAGLGATVGAAAAAAHHATAAAPPAAPRTVPTVVELMVGAISIDGGPLTGSGLHLQIAATGLMTLRLSAFRPTPTVDDPDLTELVYGDPMILPADLSVPDFLRRVSALGPAWLAFSRSLKESPIAGDRRRTARALDETPPEPPGPPAPPGGATAARPRCRARVDAAGAQTARSGRQGRQGCESRSPRACRWCGADLSRGERSAWAHRFSQVGLCDACRVAMPGPAPVEERLAA